jgi:hypothetical protein
MINQTTKISFMTKLIFKLKSFAPVVFLVFSFSIINAQPFITGDTLSPSITYMNIPDTILPRYPGGYFDFDIDIDFDATNDIRFHRDHSHSPSHYTETFSVLSLNTIQFVCVANSSIADTLSPGSIINNTLSWNNNYDGACLYHNFVSNIPPPWGPPSSHYGICFQENNYIGFRKIYPSDTIYGWFFFDLYNYFKIKSFAIDDILNNDTNLQFFPDRINIFPNPASNFIQIFLKDPAIRHFQLTIINSNGKEILNSNIEYSNNYVINLQNYPGGLYYIKMKNKDEQYHGKLLIVRP